MEEIINKYEILNKLNLNQDFIQNIQLFYVFNRGRSVFIVTNDDKVYAVGSNECGVLGFGHRFSVNELTINQELSHKRIIDFKNGWRHTIARTSDGKVYCWGLNVWGLLGNGRDDRIIYKPILNQDLNGNHIVDICCGGVHSLVLTIDRDIYAWGSNLYGQIGNGKYGHDEYQLMPYHLGFGGQKVKAISCGFWHSMALTEAGNVFSWGWNYYGQLGIGTEVENTSPKRIEFEIVIQKISCNLYHSLLLSRDETFTCSVGMNTENWELMLKMESN